MENINLSILVVACKDYQPSYYWYFCKSGKYFCGTPKEHDTIGYDAIKLDALNTSPDFVSLPDCHRMTDEEAAEVIKNWCIQNDIPYNDDMDNIEETYRRYYKYDKYDYPADIIEEETMIKVYCYSRCSTCRKALKWLDDNGVKYEAIDIKADHPDESTLRMYYEKSGLPLKRFFNTSGMQYRDLGLSKKLPDMSEDEQLALLASDGMLVKRPLVVDDGFILTGFKEEEWSDKLK